MYFLGGFHVWSSYKVQGGIGNKTYGAESNSISSTNNVHFCTDATQQNNYTTLKMMAKSVFIIHSISVYNIMRI